MGCCSSDTRALELEKKEYESIVKIQSMVRGK